MASSNLTTCTDLTWKMKFNISFSNFIMKFICRSDGTINRRLYSFLHHTVPSSVEPTNGVKTYDITIDPSRNLWFRLFTPTAAVDDGSNDAEMPLVIYFHGGGFVLMAADSYSYDTLCRRYAAELNAVVISVNYRLSPEHKYPSQYEDGFDVLKFIENNPNFENLPTNVNLKQCFLAGESAGGNIAHHVAVKACSNQFNNLKIIGVMAIQPGFCGQERTESELKIVGSPFLSEDLMACFGKAFLPEGSDRDHPALNVFGPKSVDISGLNFPATIVIVGGQDPLQDWQKRYYDGLKKRAKEAYLIEYPNAFHGFSSMPELLESHLHVNELRGFMQKQSAKITSA